MEWGNFYRICQLLSASFAFVNCLFTNSEHSPDHDQFFKRSSKFFASGFAKSYPDFPSPQCTDVTFDIGFNNGKDTAVFLQNNMCVVSVDANHAFIEEGKKKFQKEIQEGRLALFNAGLSEINSGAIPFYLGVDPLHSSFNKRKAACVDEIKVKLFGVEKCDAMGENLTKIMIPTYHCGGLWSSGLTPWFTKIDIEEMHYVCVLAIPKLSLMRRPKYVSWEMHEFAKAVPFPVLDANLLSELGIAGYNLVKLVSQIGLGYGGGELTPEKLINFLTRNSSWTPLETFLSAGIPNARKLGTFWDFVMKRI